MNYFNQFYSNLVQQDIPTHWQPYREHQQYQQPREKRDGKDKRWISSCRKFFALKIRG